MERSFVSGLVSMEEWLKRQNIKVRLALDFLNLLESVKIGISNLQTRIFLMIKDELRE